MRILVACEESQAVTIELRKLGHEAYSCDTEPCSGGHPLAPTNIVDVSESTKVVGNWFNKGGKERQKNRAKTFPGIAKAMAGTWAGNIL